MYVGSDRESSGERISNVLRAQVCVRLRSLGALLSLRHKHCNVTPRKPSLSRAFFVSHSGSRSLSCPAMDLSQRILIQMANQWCTCQTSQTFTTFCLFPENTGLHCLPPPATAPPLSAPPRFDCTRQLFPHMPWRVNKLY